MTSLCSRLEAVTEFVSKINCGSSSCSGTEDYGVLSTWETAMSIPDITDLTNSTVFCGGWGTKVASTIADATAISWDAGLSTGTLVHQTDHTGTADDQYALVFSAGTAPNGSEAITDGTNGFTATSVDSCIMVAKIYDDDGNLSSEDPTISGLTTSTANYRKITVPAGERHNGIIAGTGARYVGSMGDGAIFSEDNLIVEWLRMYASGSSSLSRAGIRLNASGGINRYLILEESYNSGTGTKTQGFAMTHTAATTTTLMESIVANTYENDCIVMGASSGGTTAIHDALNVTGHDCGDGASEFVFEEVNGVNTVKNSSGFGNNANAVDFDSGWSNQTTNACSDTSCTGQQSLTESSQFTDLTDKAEDFHLITGAGLIDNGTDLGTTPSGIDFDIDNYQKDTDAVAWDIGADEFVAAPGGSSTVREIIINITKAFYKNYGYLTYLGESTSQMICYPYNWIAKQEAGKCNFGHRWETIESITKNG